MKLSQMNDYLQTLATLGAIVGLLAVIYEVRQSNQIAEATLDFEVWNNLSQVNELIITNPALSELLTRANTGGAITREETVTLYTYNLRLVNAWAGMETAYRNGVLPRSTFQAAFDDIRISIESTGQQRQLLWKQILDDYPSIRDTEVGKAAHAALKRARGKTAD